jgi:hypothetical protein
MEDDDWEPDDPELEDEDDTEPDELDDEAIEHLTASESTHEEDEP